MLLTHLVRVTCCHCRAATIMESSVAIIYGEIVTTPRLVNTRLVDDDEYFCGIICKGASDKKRPSSNDGQGSLAQR